MVVTFSKENADAHNVGAAGANDNRIRREHIIQ
jgi:hypothetical protein